MQLSNFLGWGDHGYDDMFRMCVWDRKASFSYTLFFVFGGVGVPVVLISICNIAVYLYVRKNEMRIAPSGDGVNATSQRTSSMSLRLSRTFAVIFIVFVVCWSPYCVLILIDQNDKAHPALHLFLALLAHFSSSNNYILYGLTNRDFRHGYWRVLKRMTAFNGRGNSIAAQQTNTFEMSNTQR